MTENHPDLLRAYDPDFLDLTKPFDTFDLPGEGIPHPLKEINPLLYDLGVVFMKEQETHRQSRHQDSGAIPLIILLAESGVHGLVRVPHDPDECERVCHEYGHLLRQTRRSPGTRSLTAPWMKTCRKKFTVPSCPAFFGVNNSSHLVELYHHGREDNGRRKTTGKAAGRAPKSTY